MGHAFPIEDHARHERATTAAAAIATLAVILAGASLSWGGSGGHGPRPPEEPRLELTRLAQRALVELPLAYRVDDVVIAPAATDPHVTWTGLVPDARIVGQALPVGARGLMPYADHVLARDAPPWVHLLGPEDRVFSDVGPLWLACTVPSSGGADDVTGPDRRRPGGGACTPSLLMERSLRHYSFQEPVGSADFLAPGAPMEVMGYDIVDGTDLGRLVVGGMHGLETARVTLSLTDGTSTTPWISKDLAVAGATVWWTTVSHRVLSATAWDEDGVLLDQATVSDGGGVLLADHQ